MKAKRPFFLARGGMYKGTDADTHTGYIKTVLAFIGITDVEFVFAEGLNLGDESKEASLNTARGEVINLVQSIKKAA